MQPALPTRPHRAVRSVWFWRGLALGIVLAPAVGWPVLLPLGSFLRQAGQSYAVAYGVAAALLFGAYVVGLWVWTRLAYGRLRFELLPDEVRIHRGVWLHSVTRIPMRRIRRVVVRRGPLLRMYRLATVRIEVWGALEASPHAPDGQLPGLRDPTMVVDWILARLNRPTVGEPTTPDASVQSRKRPSR